MLAPNMNLELGFREPVQTSGNSQRLEQKSSGPSSFERALERARTEKTSASEPAEAKTDETVESQSKISKEGEQVVLEESAPKVAEEIQTLEKTIAAQIDTEKKSLNLPILMEEIAPLSETISTEVVLAEGLDPEALSKELLLQQSELDEKISEPVTKEPTEEGVLVLAESLEAANKAQEMQPELSEKKSKKIEPKDVDYSIAQILQNNQQGEKLTEGNPVVVEGSIAEVQGEGKALKLETGTSLDQKIEVQDLRTAAENGVTEASLKDGNFVTTVSQGEGTADITMQLAPGTETSGNASVATGSKETNFSAMLSNQLQNNATELVQTGSIILRDGNVGTINLILHPEELGNVKISLELNDKIVSAQIKVASEEAFQAFKESIASLKQAFADSGFDTGSFDLSWAGSGQQQQGGQQQQNHGHIAFANTLYGEMLAEDGIDSGVEGEILQKTYSDSSQIAVNIMA